MTRKGIFWPTLSAALGLAVLVGLGTWQVQRLHWKEGLIARIEARAKAKPVSLDQALARWRETGEVEYLRARLTGRFLHEDELHLYGLVNGEPGWRIVTPLVTPEGAIVLVDRGFVPNPLKAPSARRQGQIQGPVEVVGLARAPETQGLFTPDNDTVANAWYWRDLVAMGRVVLTPEQQAKLAPFFVEAEPMAVPGGWPRGGVTRLELPNRHLEYAITWYGLAVVLVVIYVLFMRGRRQTGG